MIEFKSKMTMNIIHLNICINKRYMMSITSNFSNKYINVKYKSKKANYYDLLKMIYVNTKIRYKPKNTTNFNQKVKMLKALTFRYDTETTLSKLFLQYIKNT